MKKFLFIFAAIFILNGCGKEKPDNFEINLAKIKEIRKLQLEAAFVSGRLCGKCEIALKYPEIIKDGKLKEMKEICKEAELEAKKEGYNDSF